MFTFYFMGQSLLNIIGSRQFVLLYLGGTTRPPLPTLKTIQLTPLF